MIKIKAAPWTIMRRMTGLPAYICSADEIGTFIGRVPLDDEKDKDTAQLIIAAPDLYEAAQAVSDAMKSNNAYDLFPAVDKLRLAIRKAEGKL